MPHAGDYDGYLPERVEANLRSALRRKFWALFDALVADRATASTPAGSQPPGKPMHASPHVFIWLLEHIDMEPAQDAEK